MKTVPNMKIVTKDIFNIILSSCKRRKQNEDTEEGKRCFSPTLNQVILSLGPLLLTIGFGTTLGYSATLLPQLKTFLQVDETQSSWIASMAALPMAFGCILGGFLIEMFGRRNTHIITCPALFLGWMLIYLAQRIEVILLGRFTTGLCCGVLGSATGVYIGETSSPSVRSFLLATISFSVAFGLFVVHLIGTFTTWQTTALICASIPVVSLLLLVFVPESPAWLVKKGRIEEAERAFYWCRGSSDEAKAELQILLEKQPKLDEEKPKFLHLIKEYLVPEFLKPLAIIVVFIVANQWAGVNAIAFYTVSILEQTLSNFDEYLAMLIVDFIRVLISVLACVLLRKFNRRPLAIISGTGTFISMAILSCYTYLNSLYPNLSHHNYIPLTALILYISFIQIGFVPLPWSMIGEVFPLKHRSVGSAISSFIALISSFSVVKTTPGMFMELGSYGTFLVYASVAIVGTIFVVAFLPETRGKTLHEIEDGFKKQLPKKVVMSKYDDDANFA